MNVHPHLAFRDYPLLRQPARRRLPSFAWLVVGVIIGAMIW